MLSVVVAGRQDQSKAWLLRCPKFVLILLERNQRLKAQLPVQQVEVCGQMMDLFHTPRNDKVENEVKLVKTEHFILQGVNTANT